MPKRVPEMSALAVQRLKEAGFHSVGGVAGLGLYVSPTGGKSWVLRYPVDKKRREMGLGAYPDVGLSQARDKAREQRELLDKGHDPLHLREQERKANAAARAAAMTFKDAAKKLIASLRPGWKNAKHAQQWENTLETYVYPVIGELDVSEVELPHVLKILEPIWATKNETASRVRSRMEQILDWATVHRYRKTDNPARWRGHLDKILPKPSKVATVEHHAAVPVSEVGAFMVKLRERNGVGARALEFAILTAARSGEVRGAAWDEFDLQGGMWVVPAERMKGRRTGGKEHRVPLSHAAVALVEAQPRVGGSKLVFTAPRGGMLSDMTLTKVLRDMGVDAVPHGFRSTFRDWAGERTNYPSDMAEMALAHVISDKVEAAYRRGDMVVKRRKMMSDWAGFCARPETAGDLIQLHNTKRLAEI